MTVKSIKSSVYEAQDSGFAILRTASHSDWGTETFYHAVAVMSLSDG